MNKMCSLSGGRLTNCVTEKSLSDHSCAFLKVEEGAGVGGGAGGGGEGREIEEGQGEGESVN